MKVQWIFYLITILHVPACFSYPVYGTKRFGRANAKLSWRTARQPFIRTQRYPMNYYDMYPYNQDYNDDYYYLRDGLSYPVYMPAPRTSKYEVYQAVLPYYYDDKIIHHPNYGYYGYDKNLENEMEEEIAQATEREEREEAQPIGQEVLYQNDEDRNRDNINDVNAAFLQNLIMSQMYNNDDDLKGKFYDPYMNSDYYFDDQIDDGTPNQDQQKLDQEDKDVRELKQLVRSQYENNDRPSNEEREYWLQKDNSNTNKKLKTKSNYNWESKRVDRESAIDNNDDASIGNRKSISSTTEIPKKSITEPKKTGKSGQKEEVLMRPATPVRHPFPEPVMNLINENPERKRQTSVYDTIKQMLDMEKNLELENKIQSGELRPQMRKRIISSEDTLTHQLSVLKKSVK